MILYTDTDVVPLGSISLLGASSDLQFMAEPGGSSDIKVNGGFFVMRNKHALRHLSRIRVCHSR